MTFVGESILLCRQALKSYMVKPCPVCYTISFGCLQLETVSIQYFENLNWNFQEKKNSFKIPTNLKKKLQRQRRAHRDSQRLKHQPKGMQGLDIGPLHIHSRYAAWSLCGIFKILIFFMNLFIYSLYILIAVPISQSPLTFTSEEEEVPSGEPPKEMGTP